MASHKNNTLFFPIKKSPFRRVSLKQYNAQCTRRKLTLFNLVQNLAQTYLWLSKLNLYLKI